MTSSFPRSWEVYLGRRTFLLSGLIAISESPGMGRSVQAWPSENLRNMLAGILLLDLASVLDSALKEYLATQGVSSANKLADRLVKARDLGLLIDYSTLDNLRQRRNAVAHEVAPIAWYQLEPYEKTIGDQLLAWGLLSETVQYTPSIQRPRDWERDAATARRIVQIGVVEAKTHRRVFGFDICEVVHIEANEPIDTALASHATESQWKAY